VDIQQIVVRGPHDVSLQTGRTPDVPEPGHLLIETEATFISAGTELAWFTGRDPQVTGPRGSNAYPRVPGYANCGRVVVVGEEVDDFAIGQRVFSFGGHVSHHHQAVHDPDRGMLVHVPSDIAPDVAAAARMAMVALTAVQTSSVQLNDWVAVLGLGSVGNLACQLFRLAGARVIGVDPLDARRELARRVGIEHVVGGDPPEVAQAVNDLTDGGGTRITVDAVGDARVVEQAAALTAAFGEVVLLGSPRTPYQTDLDAVVRPVHYQWVTFKGALEWKIPRYPTRGARHSTYENALTIFDLARRGRLKLPQLISHRLPPERIKIAYEGLLNDRQHFWGVVLDWAS
jgi:2-desacetyl-2-hydroxyethyl bacteriochlorophyllide A dehydrogenase